MTREIDAIDENNPVQMCAVMRLVVRLKSIPGCQNTTPRDVIAYGGATDRTVQICVRGIPFAEALNPADAS